MRVRGEVESGGVHLVMAEITAPDESVEPIYKRTDLLYPHFADYVNSIITSLNAFYETPRWVIQETYRTPERHKRLHTSRFKLLRPSISMQHTLGLACDIAFVPKGEDRPRWESDVDWERLGHEARKRALLWYGDFPARGRVCPHIEWPTSDLQTAEAARRFIESMRRIRGIK